MSIEWIQWGDAPAWFGGGIAVIAAVYAARQAREARRSRESSEAAANRSNEIAQRALELQEAAARAAEPPKVAWRIDRLRGTEFRLRNVGTDGATGVTAQDRRGGDYLSSLPSSNPLTRGLPFEAEIGANQSLDFTMLAADDCPLPAELWIRWDGRPEFIAVPVT